MTSKKSFCMTCESDGRAALYLKNFVQGSITAANQLAKFSKGLPLIQPPHHARVESMVKKPFCPCLRSTSQSSWASTKQCLPRRRPSTAATCQDSGCKAFHQDHQCLSKASTFLIVGSRSRPQLIHEETSSGLSPFWKPVICPPTLKFVHDSSSKVIYILTHILSVF